MNVFLLDFVEFTDEFSSQTKGGVLEDAFSFTEDAFPHRYDLEISDRIVWTETAGQIGSRAFTLGDTLVLSEDMSHGPRASFSDQFYMIDYFPRPNSAMTLDDEITWVDEMEAVAGPGISDALLFVEDLDYTIITIRVATDTLTLRDGFGAYLNNPWTPIFPVVEAS